MAFESLENSDQKFPIVLKAKTRFWSSIVVVCRYVILLDENRIISQPHER